MAKGTKFQSHVIDELKNPEIAAHYIMAALEENDADFLAQAMSNVVKAHGTSKVSRASHITRQALYKMFSSSGNPTLNSVNAVLNAVGLKLSVTPKRVKKTA